MNTGGTTARQSSADRDQPSRDSSLIQDIGDPLDHAQERDDFSPGDYTRWYTASYKKKIGVLWVSENMKYLLWWSRHPPNSYQLPSTIIPVANIENLQQTPEASVKRALKVVLQDRDYVFVFDGDNAREWQIAVTDRLRDAMAAGRSSSSGDQTLVSTPRAVWTCGQLGCFSMSVQLRTGLKR